MRKYLTEPLKQEMTAWRHDIHQHPELGFKENRTAEKVAELLKDFGIETHERIGGTGIVGVLKKGNSNRAIGLRADLDALPIQERGACCYRSVHDGIFHGCGHDGHTTMLLGAAHYLAQHGDFDGTVYFIFQPGEENGKGALAMMADGLFERFPMHAIYGMHNMPGIPTGQFAVKSGQMMTSEDNFVITITGKGGHASMPHMTIDPMVIGAEIVLALQTITSRSISPADWGVVSVTEFLTDGARNILPSTVIIKGDVRTLSADIQVLIEKRMRELVDGIAKAHGATACVEYSYEFVALVNSEHETAAAIDAAEQTVGAEKVDGNCRTNTVSEDFAQFLRQVPGCFILIGNGDEKDDRPLHNPFYDYKDANLTIGADYWVNLVQRQLSAEDRII